MNKKLMVTLVVVVAMVLLLLGGMALRKSSAPAVDEWTLNLQKQKQVPFTDGTFTLRGGQSIAIKYRVFKPVIDLNVITGIADDWRKNPTDSFLYQRYIAQYDPNPTFAKYAESLVEGEKTFESALKKFPEYKQNPKGYFKRFFRKHDEEKLLGEIIVNGIHIQVYVVADINDWPLKIGAPFVKNDSGDYCGFPKLTKTDKIINALAQDRYSIIFKHFPEYDGPKTEK